MVALFPGRTEVIEKYGRVISDLVAAGYGVAVMDWRGQGMSDRLTPDPLLGDVTDFQHYQRDVAELDCILRAYAPKAPRFVLAHSMGGAIALRALMRGFDAQAAAFSAPMWGLPVSPLVARAFALGQKLLGLSGLDLRPVPGAGVEFRLWENPFDNNDLTLDRPTYDWMQAQVRAQPALQLGAPSLRWLGAALREVALLADLPSPQMPAYCGLGTRERVVSGTAIATRMTHWPGGEIDVFNDALHEILMEKPEHRDRFLTRTLALFAAHQP
ncbi:MAG: alpha/beta fold hydrolase [Roseinatronobacter sp.]